MVNKPVVQFTDCRIVHFREYLVALVLQLPIASPDIDTSDELFESGEQCLVV
jgi:hypothetical protein